MDLKKNKNKIDFIIVYKQINKLTQSTFSK